MLDYLRGSWAAYGLCAYAALMIVESYGLWMVRRWGEYFSVIATSVFLPWEIYEVGQKVTALRLVLLLINIAAVVCGWSCRNGCSESAAAALLPARSTARRAC